MYRSKIVAFIGAIIFVIAGVLPLISVSGIFSISLRDVYSLFAQSSSYSTTVSNYGVELSAQSFGLLMTIIFYPVAVILGFLGIWKRKLALAAGIIGLLCWIGAIIALATPVEESLYGASYSYSLIQFMGAAVYVGLIGAIILLIAGFLKPRAQIPQMYTPQPAYSPAPAYASQQPYQQPYPPQQQPYQQYPQYQQQNMRICPQCGQAVDPNQRFCPHCGKQLF